MRDSVDKRAWAKALWLLKAWPLQKSMVQEEEHSMGKAGKNKAGAPSRTGQDFLDCMS